MNQVLVAHDFDADCIPANIKDGVEIDWVVGTYKWLWWLWMIDKWIPYNNFVVVTNTGSDILSSSYRPYLNDSSKTLVMYVFYDNPYWNPQSLYLQTYLLDKILWTFTKLSWSKTLWAVHNTPTIWLVSCDWTYVYVNRAVDEWTAYANLYYQDKYTIATDSWSNVHTEWLHYRDPAPTRYTVPIWTQITNNEIVDWTKKLIFSWEARPTYPWSKVRYPLITIEDI